MSNGTNQEEVLWSGTVSQWHYLGKWIFVLFLIALIAASFVLQIPEIADYLWPARAIVGAIAVITILWIHLDRSRRKYTVTNKRVSVEFGLVSRESNEVRVQDIRSINLTKVGISGLFGIGRLEFSSAATDDADIIFWNCPGAQKIRDLVRSLQA